MKRSLTVLTAVMLLAVLLCACGKKNITTSVAPAYDDGVAADYAEKVATDENGNQTYEFTPDQYEEYTRVHNNTISADMEQEVAGKHDEPYGEYIYINEEKQAVYVGIHADEYDPDTAQAEAASLADQAWKYFKSIENPVSKISVIYCNAGDQSEEYARFDFTAE